MRADAERNRGRLLEAAAAAFAEEGLDVPVAEISRRACVGPGTLFRHFPTKDDLIAAIAEQRMRELQALAEQALDARDPWNGIETFLTRAAEMHAGDRGLMHALKHRALETPALEPCRAGLRAAVSRVIDRGHAAGVLREDFRPEDVPVLLSSIGSCAEGWRRHLAFVLDGLRVSTSAAAPASARPRS